jgi:hypothetical protein
MELGDDMTASITQRMSGVDFVVDRDGEKKAVLIDLRRHRDLWEDFYDTLLAQERRAEPRESLAEVKRKVLGNA